MPKRKNSINGYRKHISFYSFKEHDFVIDYKYTLEKLIHDTGFYHVVAVGLEYELITGKEIIVADGCLEKPVRKIEVTKFIDLLGNHAGWNWNLSMKVLNELKVYNTLKDQTKMVRLVDFMIPMHSGSEEQHYRKMFQCKFRDMYFVFERYGNDLSFILKKEPSLEISIQKWLLSELLSAVSSLHSQKLIHRDLRPSNVCVSFYEKILKLKSFGLSSGFSSKVYLEDDEEEDVEETEITPIYTAPEIILGGASSPLVDVWGVGCIFAEILSGGSPLFFLPSGTKPTVFNKIGAIIGTLEHKRVSYLDNLSPSNPLAIDLLRRMLDFNPHTRISVEEAKQHAYFGGGAKPVGGSSSSRVVALAEEEDVGVVEVTVPEVVEPDVPALRKLIWKEMETFEMNKKKTLEMNKKKNTFEMNKKRAFEMNREIFEMNKKTPEIPLES